GHGAFGPTARCGDRAAEDAAGTTREPSGAEGRGRSRTAEITATSRAVGTIPTDLSASRRCDQRRPDDFGATVGPVPAGANVQRDAVKVVAGTLKGARSSAMTFFHAVKVVL